MQHRARSLADAMQLSRALWAVAEGRIEELLGALAAQVAQRTTAVGPLAEAALVELLGDAHPLARKGACRRGKKGKEERCTMLNVRHGHQPRPQLGRGYLITSDYSNPTRG